MDDPRVADRWWDTLSPERRCQIYRWIERPETALEVAGQIELPLR